METDVDEDPEDCSVCSKHVKYLTGRGCLQSALETGPQITALLTGYGRSAGSVFTNSKLSHLHRLFSVIPLSTSYIIRLITTDHDITKTSVDLDTDVFLYVISTTLLTTTCPAREATPLSGCM